MKNQLDFCQKHRVDYTGTWCGGCVLLWKKHSLELKKIKKNNKPNKGDSMSFTTKKYTRPLLVSELKALKPSAFKSVRSLALALSPRSGMKSAKFNALNNFVSGVGYVMLQTNKISTSTRSFKNNLIKALSI